ncbi:ABC transporter ATP-binding protein [Gryllotalpicola protaetiae]|uniref:ABC transporter ATP-binding protein n=1 Tax=Gryllotalpicola protaetiae TaxID=2419771 RepID=A0A387BQH1_9MICO|nr:ABC transporter ATP-binding protein [Gryllotalpicola protaetiae]
MPAPGTLGNVNERVIELSGLRKTFGRITAVDCVDLTIRRGEVVALLGPNGAGKSTTIDLALGLSTPTAGTAQLFGGTPRDAIVAGWVGAMLQGGALLPTATVRESVALIAAVHRTPLSVDEALRRARCTEIADQKVAKLSGGQTQRARFAVAIVSNPELLLLDEPTAAMDVEARRTFWESMRGLTDEGRTVVFATHYLDEADTFADRIVMLRAGRVVADGTPAQVKAVVSGRTIRATLPSVSEADAASIRSLPGVTALELRGDRLALAAADSDRTLRALLGRYPELRDIEVAARSMDDAFLALTEAEALR